MRFASPLLGLIALAFVVAVWWYRRRLQVLQGTLRYSDIGAVKQRAGRAGALRRLVLGGLRTAALLLCCVAVARPQSQKSFDEVTTEGIDIMLALDLSGSMKALDFKPDTRADAARKVISRFIKGLRNDRVGLVVFGTKSYLQCPLTLDYGALLSFLDQCKVGMAGNETNIAAAIGVCADRLKDQKAKSKVVILLTDGEQTTGNLDPITAARAAHAVGVRVYTIAMGATDHPMVEVDDPIFGKRLQPIEAPIDEDTLRRIATEADGKFYRATDTDTLARIYKDIWHLEKSKIKVKNYQRFNEKFPAFLLPALLLLLLETGLAHTIFRKLP